MRPRDRSRPLAHAILWAYLASCAYADTKVGPGSCTWSGGSTFAGETVVLPRSSGLTTFGTCRALCEGEHGVRLVGYEFTSEHCKCFLASGTYDTSPDGATSVNQPGGCYATRPSVWCSSIDQRIALTPVGRGVISTHADVFGYLKPVAHKQIAAAASTAAACVCAAFESSWLWGQSTH
jgi:hypothetical protein